MKHILASLRLMAMLLGVILLSACSQQPAPKFRIGVSQCSDDAWRTKFNEELHREQLFHPGYTLEIRTAKDDNSRQESDMDYFIDHHFDLIIVAPNEAAQLTPSVSRAFDAGIPVVVADRNVTGSKYTAFVGGDNVSVGHIMAQYLKTQLPDGGKVMEVLGLQGSTPSMLRHRGMMEELGADSARYEWVTCCGRWFRQEAQQVADSMLRQHPDVAFIMAQNDQMAIGARAAVDALGLDHRVVIMGVDGLTGPGNGVEAIVDGLIDASAVYATRGDLVLQTAVHILEGQPYERNTELATYLIQPDAAPMLSNFSKEVDHQVKTVHMLKDRVDYYWQQHNLERSLLYTVLAALALIVGFLVLLYRGYTQKQRLNASLARQKDLLKAQRDQLAAQNEELTRLSAELEEATRAKLLFFTNVSHDFRTPLTLINGPVEQLQADIRGDEGKALTPAQRASLTQLIHKNVQVLLRLVNQILDFRKYESGKMELNLQDVDLHRQVADWTESFQGLAHKKHIRLGLTVEGEQFCMKGDLAKLERIFYNVMGNAFKFTPENGRITVTLTSNTPCQGGSATLTLRIADTGPGISVEHIQKIFENFYQIDSLHHEGSGIGLALVKNFVEMHGGTISVANQPVGTGSVFTIQLPASTPGSASSTRAELGAQGEAAALRHQVEAELTDYTAETDEVSDAEPRPIVLVIDDNADIRNYIATLLAPDYRVVGAAAGQEGIGRAMRMVPDVIICDVMMPGMDGIECCRRLKGEVNTCHIPVLMLTACSLDEQRVMGLSQGGADAYMAKPFNASVLRAQIGSLISNHNRVRDFFSPTTCSASSTRAELGAHPHTPTPSQGVKDTALTSSHLPSSLDDQFLARLRQLIEQHLADSEFGVEQLGDQIGMSRAQLYRKCKALTNYSPVELIRNTRLKRGQMMLAQGSETIAQVAYSVGFTAPSYFTKCYKEYFGEMPNELLKRKG